MNNVKFGLRLRYEIRHEYALYTDIFMIEVSSVQMIEYG